jgi:hypothetical protein
MCLQVSAGLPAYGCLPSCGCLWLPAILLLVACCCQSAPLPSPKPPCCVYCCVCTAVPLQLFWPDDGLWYPVQIRHLDSDSRTAKCASISRSLTSPSLLCNEGYALVASSTHAAVRCAALPLRRIVYLPGLEQEDLDLDEIIRDGHMMLQTR